MLMSRFNNLRQDNEKMHLELKLTKDVLEQTQIIPGNAKEQWKKEGHAKKPIKIPSIDFITSATAF